MENIIKTDKSKMYDVVIIGGGPAGLTAALYLARAGYKVVVVEKESFGGQIKITDEIVNYPGVGRATGEELTEDMKKQAEDFGAEFLIAEAESIFTEGDVKKVKTDRGELLCLGVLLAMGAKPRRAGFQGEEKFKGRGVAYCATCDGEFFTGKEVFVIGGGLAAAEEAVFLTRFAKHVTMLILKEDFSCPKYAADEARNNEKITVLTNTKVESVYGDSVLRGIRYSNTVTGEVTEYEADVTDGEDTFGIFVFAGYVPDTGMVKGIVKLNEQGYIETDQFLRTSKEGIYAAGDVCIKPLRQVTTAVGDGAVAATELEKYVTGIKRETPAPNRFFGDEVVPRLKALFEPMKEKLILKLYLDSRPVSDQLRQFTEELAKITDKLMVEVREEGSAVGKDSGAGEDSNVGKDSGAGEDSDVGKDGGVGEELPCVKVCREDGKWTGLAFHGVPGGHEFTPFVMGLCNAAGGGEPLGEDVMSDIKAISRKTDIKVLITLSCPMCPDLVAAAQRIALENNQVTAQVYDVSYFEELRKQYNVMSVPCLVVNDGEVVQFGRRNIRQVLDILKNI